MKILHIDIDTLMPSHLSCYGYKRDTSSNIDKNAKKGIKFPNFFAGDSLCVQYRSTTFGGKYGFRNGVITHEDRGLVIKNNMIIFRYKYGDRNAYKHNV